MNLAPGLTLGVLLIILSVLAGLGFRALAGRSRAWPRLPGSTPGGPSASSASDEHTASSAIERIEEHANRALSRTPGLEGTRLDFGTASDGSLEIWVDDRRYQSLSEIADVRIRQAIEDAVAAFNR